jgi:oligoendopeptidase F
MTKPVHDANATGSGQGALGDLPEWDLSALYASPDDPALKRDLDWLEEAAASYARDYEGKYATLDAPGLAEAVKRHERIGQVAGRIMSYAGLRYYQRTTDAERAKFLSDCEDRVTAYTTPLVFSSLEFNRLPDEHLEALYGQSQELSRYRPHLDRVRAMKPHQLSDELERFLHDQSTVGASAWNKLFDETIAGLKFDVEGEPLGIEATLNLLQDKERARREAGFRALAEVFGQTTKTFARIHNTLAKEKEIEDRWRGFPTPQASRHLARPWSRLIRGSRTATTG